jgi:hypothetical protein
MALTSQASCTVSYPPSGRETALPLDIDWALVNLLAVFLQVFTLKADLTFQRILVHQLDDF